MSPMCYLAGGWTEWTRRVQKRNSLGLPVTCGAVARLTHLYDRQWPSALKLAADLLEGPRIDAILTSYPHLHRDVP